MNGIGTQPDPPDEDPGDMYPYSTGIDPADGMPWEQ